MTPCPHVAIELLWVILENDLLFFNLLFCLGRPFIPRISKAKLGTWVIKKIIILLDIYAINLDE